MAVRFAALRERTADLALRCVGSLLTSDVPSLSVAALRRRTDSAATTAARACDEREILLVDVRAEEETAVSMIPNAITRQQYEDHRELYADRCIVSYCTVGYRSAKYTKKLIKQGVDAVNLSGSIIAWAEAGLPLVTPDGRKTKRLHTWSRSIQAPAGYEQVIE